MRSKPLTKIEWSICALGGGARRAKVVVLLTHSNSGGTQTNHRKQVTYIPATSAGRAKDEGMIHACAPTTRPALLHRRPPHSCLNPQYHLATSFFISFLEIVICYAPIIKLRLRDVNKYYQLYQSICLAFAKYSKMIAPSYNTNLRVNEPELYVVIYIGCYIQYI